LVNCEATVEAGVALGALAFVREAVGDTLGAVLAGVGSAGVDGELAVGACVSRVADALVGEGEQLSGAVAVVAAGL